MFVSFLLSQFLSFKYHVFVCLSVSPNVCVVASLSELYSTVRAEFFGRLDWHFLEKGGGRNETKRNETRSDESANARTDDVSTELQNRKSEKQNPEFNPPMETQTVNKSLFCSSSFLLVLSLLY